MERKSLNEVQPDTWVPSNRVGFLPWIYQTFPLSKYPDTDSTANILECTDDICEVAPAPTKKQRFFSHQRIVRDILQLESPYRGLLLFHSLGTGKSATSIAAAEGFTARHKKVHVLMPAALEQNYVEEIKKYGHVGRGLRGKWVEVRVEPASDAYKVLHKMHRLPAEHFVDKAWVPFVPEDFPKTNVVREVAYKDLKPSDLAKVDKVIQKMIAARYTFTNYNGLTKAKVDQMSPKDFDYSFVIIDEAHNFIRMVANQSVIARKVYQCLADAKDMKILLLSGTPIINHPYELGLMLNLVRGTMTVYEMTTLKDSQPLVVEEIVAKLRERENVWKHIDMLDVSADYTTLRLSLIPRPYLRAGETDRTMVKRVPLSSLELEKILDGIRETLAPQVRLGKRTKEALFSAFPPKKEDFDQMFLDVTDPQHPVVKNADLFMRRSIGLVSYLRTAGEELFPRMTSREVKEIPLADESFKHYLEVRDKEIKMDEKRQKRLLRQKTAANIMDAGDPVVYRAFSRMACNYTFPEGIKREFPAEIRTVLKREISASEDIAPMEEGKIDISAEADKKYEEHKREIMNTLRTNASKYLTLAALRKKYSSKMATMLTDLEQSPGKCLVYSQFREIEGLGVLRLAMETQKWIEIDLERRGNEYYIRDAEKVLSPAYNSKRFVVFSDDRVKTGLLLQIFNGQYDRLPSSIQDQLQNLPHKNLYGEVARVMMITAAATEGISLRCVRRVLIMEPFWNMVRMDQVIGRAIRAGSHLDLPEEDRTVDVITYVATLTKEQFENNFTLKTKDNGLSSDQSILLVAERKNRIIEQFLKMIKSSAIDCMIHAKKNRPLQQEGEHRFQCYAFPINMDDDAFAYVPDIAEDQAIKSMRHLQGKNIQAKAVMVKNKKYAAYGDPPQLYDYDAYTDAGVLIPASP